MNRQVYIKAEQIARMRVKGIPMTRICIEMGMSYDGLVRITRDPTFLQIEDAVRQQVTGKMDARLAQRAQMEDEVEDAVPEAMKVLLENMRAKRDLKAALEVLDRDPQRQFAKGAAGKPLGGKTSNPVDHDLLNSTAASADQTREQIGRNLNTPPIPTQPSSNTNLPN